ncbi:MAG: pyridoxal-phosphate dependent enzyme [Candidatus Saccharibacteria bacterium]
MSPQETLALSVAYEAYEQESLSDLIAARVLERALPLSSFEPDATTIVEFREKMGVRPLHFTHAEMGDIPVLIADDLGQPSGAFKSRGASYAIMKAQAADTVMAASAGNHGNGVAIAARRAGKASYVHAAANASPVKVENMRNNGATVINEHASVDAAVPAAIQMSRDTGATFIHPYDNLDVIAGQATVGFEMIEELLQQHLLGEIDVHNDPIRICMPIGGGGLISGVAIAVRWAKDQGLLGEQVAVYGAQMQGCDAMNRAVQNLRSGQDVENLFEDDALDTACDGTAVTSVGELTLPIVADTRYVQKITTVAPYELADSMDSLSKFHGQPVEPAGALSLAGATRDSRREFGQMYYVTFTSGGNVSEATQEHFKAEQAARHFTRARCAIASGQVTRHMVAVAR